VTIWNALLWKPGEKLNYKFFAVLPGVFPVDNISDREVELQQQINELKKENGLYQKILLGKLGSKLPYYHNRALSPPS
jgi:hypothetical protein